MSSMRFLPLSLPQGPKGVTKFINDCSINISKIQIAPQCIKATFVGPHHSTVLNLIGPLVGPDCLVCSLEMRPFWIFFLFFIQFILIFITYIIQYISIIFFTIFVIYFSYIIYVTYYLFISIVFSIKFLAYFMLYILFIFFHAYR